MTGRNRWWTVRVSPRRTSTHTQLALVQDPNESIGGGWPGRSPPKHQVPATTSLYDARQGQVGAAQLAYVLHQVLLPSVPARADLALAFLFPQRKHRRRVAGMRVGSRPLLANGSTPRGL